MLTFDRVRGVPLGGVNLEVQRLGAPRGGHLAEDKGALGIGARDVDDVRGRHLGPRREVGAGLGTGERPDETSRRLEGCRVPETISRRLGRLG